MTKRAIFSPAKRGGKSWAAGLSTDQPAKKAQKRSGRAPKPRPDPKPIDDIQGLPAGLSVVVPFPPVELSPNFRGHWSKVSKVTKNYRRLCWALALEAKLKVPAYAGTDGKIAVRLDFFPPDRTSRDDDNVPASFKAGRDGIADALKCDDARFETTNVLRSEPRSCVVVTLIDPDGGSGVTCPSKPQRRRVDPDEAILRRQRYLPGQLAATRQKLAMLRKEALRLGMPELVAFDDEAARRMQEGAD